MTTKVAKLDLGEELKFVYFWFDVEPGMIKHPSANIMYDTVNHQAIDSITGEFIQIVGGTTEEQALFLTNEAPTIQMNQAIEHISIKIESGKITLATKRGEKEFTIPENLVARDVSKSIFSAFEALHDVNHKDVISEETKSEVENMSDVYNQGDQEDAFIADTPVAEPFEDGVLEDVQSQEDALIEYHASDDSTDSDSHKEDTEDEAKDALDEAYEVYDHSDDSDDDSHTASTEDEGLSAGEFTGEVPDSVVDELVEDVQDASAEVAELQEEIAILEDELKEVKAALRKERIANKRLKAAFKKQASPLDDVPETPSVDVTAPVQHDDVTAHPTGTEFDHNNGEDIKEFQEETDVTMAPGDEPLKTASELDALKLAELQIDHGLASGSKWELAVSLAKESALFVETQIRALEAMPKKQAEARVVKKASAPSKPNMRFSGNSSNFTIPDHMVFI
ncbi:MAG: hypothetical protein HXK00_00625 [Abiotrophia defectiva]|uniref:Uncharacterized protein n=1 Tax=Abiotrophia defectiva TaxID=46125 RepID=A0A929QSU0_ABIDE|nr:hypothetical protein [Abiotrophia defectiva]